MSKLSELDRALREAIHPGSLVHLTTSSRAATRAIQREFRGEDMGLTLIMLRVGGGHAADLVASGLVRRVVAGSYGALSSHFLGGLPQIARTYREGSVEFQHWSLLSLTQRLRAAALGLDFAQTHSLVGSSMARDNGEDYRTVASPFDDGSPSGVMQPLSPDISIIHALATDEDGNTILVPPLEEGAWGALASRHGAIVTAERIVSRGYIRAHSHLTQIPAQYVRAVCHVPFGAHPGRFGSSVLGELNSYEADEDFDKAYFTALRDPSELTNWVEQWVYGPVSHEAYLDLVGREHLEDLARTPQKTRLSASPTRVVPGEGFAEAASDEVLMTLALREILHMVRSEHCNMLLVGVGLSEVPAIAAHQLLADEGLETALVMGHGYFDFEPAPGQSEPDADSAVMSTDASKIYELLLGGVRRTGLAIVGAGQVDRFGNLNSTLIGGQLLVGSGGSNDAVSVCHTVVVTRLSARKCVSDVEYVTCPGDHVRAVVTDRGVFRKNATTKRLELSSLVSDDRADEETIAELATLCGWDLEISADLKRTEPPSLDELSLIRWLMPERYRVAR